MYYLNELNIEYFTKKNKSNNSNIYNIACNIKAKKKVKLVQRFNYLKYLNIKK